MKYTIRSMKPNEYYLLEEFLYEAIYQRDENNLFPKSILNDPALQIYCKDFGILKDDYCLCTIVDEKIVGAVWVRIIDGFGSVDDTTPEFAISLYKDYRGKGMGTKLMQEMLTLLKNKGYVKTSLAVQKDNYALSLYKKVGFQIIDENEEEYIMIYYL